MSVLLSIFAALTFFASPTPAAAQTVASVSIPSPAVPSVPVPFFSQFSDISSPKWQKVGCGITDLAMIIDYYRPGAVTVNPLLIKGIAAGAYDNNAGWTYAGLIGVAKPYGFTGTYYNFASLGSTAAFAQLEKHVAEGPVMASVHYKLDPKSTIPHLIVVYSIRGGFVYYNDPANKSGGTRATIAQFLRGWKGRIVVIRPSQARIASNFK